jgi:hypothetical protein
MACALSLAIWRLTGNFLGWLVFVVPGGALVVAGFALVILGYD